MFEKILNLDTELTGQMVKIKSIFNTDDKDPSMVIFYNEEEGVYRFKDFSSGNYGDPIDILQHIEKLDTRQKAYRRMLEIFKSDEAYSLGNDGFSFTKTTIIKERKRVTGYSLRKWNMVDEKYFREYGINKKFLNEYCIKPLKSYTFQIQRGEFVDKIKFQPDQCYGFFTKDNKLYKIYNPTNKKAKFILVKKGVVQGEEQLKYQARCLIIASSLKDIGAFHSLKFKSFELVAPDSENVMLSKEKIDEYRMRYPYVFCMFDNDIAGMKSMLAYEKEYEVPYINFTVEKDMAEARKEHGQQNTIFFFKEAFAKAIVKHNKMHPI